MLYTITFKSRGDVTDDQQEDLLRKLKLSLVRSKEKGRSVTWWVKGKKQVSNEDLIKAMRKFKVSKEMSNAQITEA